MIVNHPGRTTPVEEGKTMSEFQVPVRVKVTANDAYSAASAVRSAIRYGVQERYLLSGDVTGEAEECVCLTTSDLNARIAAAVREATGTSTTPASA